MSTTLEAWQLVFTSVYTFGVRFTQDVKLVEPRLDGNLRRLATEASLLVPADIELAQRSDQLCWQPPNEEKPVPPDLLFRFCALAEEKTPAKQILEFARSHGVLALCRHDLPAVHDWRCFKPMAHPRSETQHRESLAAWRRYAIEARAVLAIARRLRDGRHGEPGQWEKIDSPLWVGLEPIAPDIASRVEPRIRLERLAVAEVVSLWLDAAGAHPRLWWWDENPEFRLGGGTLFSALSVQLLLAVSSVQGFAVCSACGHPYIPQPGPSGRTYTPRAGQPHYCRDCKSRAAAIRQRRSWERRRRGVSDGNGEVS